MNQENEKKFQYTEPKAKYIGSKMSDFYSYVGVSSGGESSVGESDIGTFKSKLEKVESRGDYNAYNKGSGAYGKYQFIPKTLEAYAKKTGQTIEQAKTPEGQDKMFEAFTRDNKMMLEKMKIPTTELNMWMAHNLGIGNTRTVLKTGKMTPRVRKAIASNLPSGVEPTIDNYINRWSRVFNS